MTEDPNNRRSDSAPPVEAETSDQQYKVGPGRPPKEHQFKPGQSGNPKGRKPKPPSVVPDLKRLFEKAFTTKVKLKQGEKERNLTKLAVGIEQLANQFAKGDRHARRDAIVYANMLGVDLLASQTKALEEALAPNHHAILEAYVRRQYDKVVQPPPVLAPPDLLDDDPEDQRS